MNDPISREAEINAICEHGTELERMGITVLAVSNHKQVTVDLLESLPSAQPERKKGRWAKQTDENCWWYECSECGDYPMKNAYGHEELSAYCPHCGAMMREDGEEDETD